MGKRGFFDEIRYCECGCGEIVTSKRAKKGYIWGHNGRIDNLGRKATEKARKNISQALTGNKNMLGHHHDEKARKNISEGRKGIRAVPISEKNILCDYGCGQKAHYRLKNGKACCYFHPAGCSARKIYGKKKFRAGLVLEAGIICSYGCGQQAHFQFKNSKFCCSMYQSGCPAIKTGSKQRKKRLPLFTIGTLCSHGCGQEAKVQFANGKFCCAPTPNECPAIRKRLKGRVPWNAGLTKNDDSSLMIVSEKQTGRDVSLKTRKKQSLAKVGKTLSVEHRAKIGEGNRDKEVSDETRKKLRMLTIDRIERQMKEGGQIVPFYNSRACVFFKQFDKDFNIQGQYATNGGEFSLRKELGYIGIDYINFDLKLIIEWDEEYHYDVDGNLREKDIRRQKEIQEHFSDFRFVRIREEKFQKEDLYESIRKIRRQE